MKSDHIASESGIPEALRNNVGYLLNKAARTIRESVSKSLKPVKLSLHEYVILRLLETKLAETQQAVGQRYDIDRTTMVTIVDELESRQLLIRQKNIQDRRSYKLVLTPKGRKTLTRAKRLAQQAHNAFLAPLTKTQQRSLLSLLGKILESGEQSTR